MRTSDKAYKVWSEIIGFLLRYSQGLDLTPLIPDMVLFGDVMQTSIWNQ